MKFKLDENFGTRTSGLFRDPRHDVRSVAEESLAGASDQMLYETCRTECRCLVTLDLDFADVLRFPPLKGPGIVVLRVPRNPSLELLENLVGYFLAEVHGKSMENNLWIVEPGRIRIHQVES